MGERLNLRNRFTVVTGASSGLGREIVRCIARDHGGNVIGVARRRDRLEALQKEIEESSSSKFVPVIADLTTASEVERCFREATEGRDVHAVVCNAGITYYGRAVDHPSESMEAMVATNVTSLLRLATRFGGYLPRGGGMMLVSSMAGLVPMPYQAAYGGTKAFVMNFGLALNHELRERGVSVTVFSPGGIATEMLESSGLSAKFDARHPAIMDAPRCADYAVKAFVRRRSLEVPSLSNGLAALAMKFLPRGLIVSALARAYKPLVQNGG